MFTTDTIFQVCVWGGRKREREREREIKGDIKGEREKEKET